MQIVYPCGCKAVVYASSKSIEQYLNPVPYLQLCSDHLAQFRISNRDLYRNIGIGV